MLRAIIFDFNGIIIDDEPLHYRSMRDIVAPLGIEISMEEYWNRYLPFDDEACLDAICKDYSIHLDQPRRQEMLGNKNKLYHQMLQNQYPLFPGVSDLVEAAGQKYPLAIASGARREDIEHTLAATGLLKYFSVVVGAEDFELGKPHPESFLLALERLNAVLDGKSAPIQPRECLVIEDSVGGVGGARAAGMFCLAVSNTYSRERLQAANQVVASLQEVNVLMIEKIAEALS
jgi:beta-phosphoglucomutase